MNVFRRWLRSGLRYVRPDAGTPGGQATFCSATSYTEPGYGHVNEDAVALRPHPQDPTVWLCALADGQGGRDGGAEAARIAVESAMAAVLNVKSRRLPLPEVWSDIVSVADEAVHASAEAGYSTLICFCVTRKQIIGASVGDSAAVLLSAGRAVRLTEKQRKNPPVGSGAAIPVTFTERLRAPWRVLAMSDGVWKYAGVDAVEAAARIYAGDALAADLRRQAAESQVGRLADDFTLACITDSLYPESASSA